eukprot:6375466-Pyramimonas_sp.AAC.1
MQAKKDDECAISYSGGPGRSGSFEGNNRERERQLRADAALARQLQVGAGTRSTHRVIGVLEYNLRGRTSGVFANWLVGRRSRAAQWEQCECSETRCSGPHRVAPRKPEERAKVQASTLDIRYTEPGFRPFQPRHLLLLFLNTISDLLQGASVSTVIPSIPFRALGFTSEVARDQSGLSSPRTSKSRFMTISWRMYRGTSSSLSSPTS